MTELYSFFALELAVRLQFPSELFQALRGVIGSAPRRQTAKQRGAAYAQVARLLLNAFEQVEYGCWEYFDDNADAHREFSHWARDMANLQGARGVPSFSGTEASLGTLYFSVTMGLLVVQDTDADLMLSDGQAQGSSLWSGEVFQNYLGVLPRLNFEEVGAGLLYMLPNDDYHALKQSDLQRQEFAHLRPIGKPAPHPEAAPR